MHYSLSSPYLTWQLLNQSGGFLISASESNLRGHRETHELFKLAPSKIATITLQHGFECVGFLMNKNHQKSYGTSVGFAADYICGWTPNASKEIYDRFSVLAIKTLVQQHGLSKPQNAP